MEPPAAPACSALHAYISDHYKAAAWAATAADQQASWDDAALTKHFIDTFGVTMKVEENLYSFKYDQILCSKWLPHVRECRGIMLCRFKTHWTVVSRPFDKFFNQFEGGCPVQRKVEFDKICSEFTAVEKVDGTCLQMWLDRRSKADNLMEAIVLADARGWRFSTLGTISPDPKFLELLKTVSDLGRIQFCCSETHTYLFELCCDANRIVTSYPTDRVYLLAARNRLSGEPLNTPDVDALAVKMGVQRPFYMKFSELKLESLEGTIEYVENEARKTIYGAGFCVYHRGVPLCKIKNKKYLEKHAMCTGDLLYQRNLVIGMFFDETIDDYKEVFSGPISAFVEELRFKVQILLKEAEQIKKDLLTKLGDKPARRLYSDTIREVVPPMYHAFFMTAYDAMYDPKKDIATEFLGWLKKHHNKFLALFKSTKVLELVEREKKVAGYNKPSEPKEP